MNVSTPSNNRKADTHPTRINASAQNIGAPWVQDLISIFNCWERIGVRQEEMEFSKKV